MPSAIKTSDDQLEASNSRQELSLKLQNCQAELAFLRQELNQVYASRSWRVTHPLRLIVHLAGNLKSSLHRLEQRRTNTRSDVGDEQRNSPRQIEAAASRFPRGKGARNINDVVGEVAQRYSVTQGFAESYFSFKRINPGGCSNCDELFDSLDPLTRMHVEFALTTTVRGRGVAALMEPYLDVSARHDTEPRYLDVGCGYGGFLRAFAEKGFKVTGLELNHELAEFSRSNVCDLSDASVVEGDLLSPAIESLGSFDCLTCNDVIEHVADAALAIDRLAALLNQEGVLFMEIPNKDAIDFVSSDGHFQIFAINCLPRQEAATYYHELTNNTGYLDHMGEFYPLEFYTDALSARGFTVELVNRFPGGDLENVPERIVNLERAHQIWLLEQAPRLSGATVEMVEDAFHGYRRRLYRDLRLARSDGDLESFLTQYLTEFWTLVARRPVASGIRGALREGQGTLVAGIGGSPPSLFR